MEDADTDMIQHYQNQLYDQDQIIQNQLQDINQLKQIITSYKTQLSTMDSKMSSFQQGETLLREANHRNDLLVSEIERLNKFVFQQGNEVEEWKNKAQRLDLALQEYKQFELSHRDMILKATRLAEEVERLKDLLLKKQQEYLQLQQELINLQQELELERQKVKALEDRLSELESETPTEKALKQILIQKTEIIRLTRQIEKLNQRNNELVEENDQLNQKYNNQLRVNDDLRNQAEENERKAKYAESNLQKAQLEIDRLNKIIEDLQNRIANENQIPKGVPIEEMNSLQDLLFSTQQQLRETQDELRDALNKLRDAENRIAQLERQIKDLEQLNKIQQDRLKSQQLTQTSQIQAPIIQQQSSSSKYLDQISDYERQIAYLQSELEKLRNAKPFDDRLLKRQIQDLQALIVLMCSEIDSLRGRIR